MPTFRVTGGALTLASTGSNYPDNTLPEGPEGPVDPGWGTRPPMGGTLPEPPPGIWPPPSWGSPIVPVDPGFGGGIPVPPGTIWPSPGRPPHIDAGPVEPRPPHVGGGPMPGGERPDAGLPQPPAGIDNTLPSQTFWMLCYAPNLGWKYVAVDPSLRPGHELPPTAEPRRRQAPP